MPLTEALRNLGVDSGIKSETSEALVTKEPIIVQSENGQARYLYFAKRKKAYNPYTREVEQCLQLELAFGVKAGKLSYLQQSGEGDYWFTPYSVRVRGFKDRTQVVVDRSRVIGIVRAPIDGLSRLRYETDSYYLSDGGDRNQYLGTTSAAIITVVPLSEPSDALKRRLKADYPEIFKRNPEHIEIESFLKRMINGFVAALADQDKDSLEALDFGDEVI